VDVRSVVISQFDLRGADVSMVTFEKCTVLSLIADGGTIVPLSFPRPSKINDISQPGQITEPHHVDEWIIGHCPDQPRKEEELLPGGLRGSPVVKLLFKACRLRQYWLRRSDDVFAARILDDENWYTLQSVLKEAGLLREESRPASGERGTFIHIRKTEQILAQDASDPDVRNFYALLSTRLGGGAAISAG
jgi:hypothetical protein